MALKLKLNNLCNNPLVAKISGIEEDVEELYLKISNQMGNGSNLTLTVSIFVVGNYLQKDMQTSDIKDFTTNCISNISYSFSPDLDGDNFIRQGYDYLKTLPEFAGCEDC